MRHRTPWRYHRSSLRSRRLYLVLSICLHFKHRLGSSFYLQIFRLQPKISPQHLFHFGFHHGQLRFPLSIAVDTDTQAQDPWHILLRCFGGRGHAGDIWSGLSQLKKTATSMIVRFGPRGRRSEVQTLFG